MKLCVALDLSNKREILTLANQIREFDLWLKVGFRSFIRDGKELIEELKSINPNFKIFLDLKLYDIPNTMADSAEEIANIGIDMFNIHASSGKIAMEMVVNRLKERKKRPLILAVTALTSFDNQTFKKIYHQNLEEKVIEFAKESYQANLDGVVCSVFESRKIKENIDSNFLTLTPGIRPFKEKSDDQKRVADLKKAKEELVDFIVVGRPIYRAKEPKEVIEKILIN